MGMAFVRWIDGQINENLGKERFSPPPRFDIFSVFPFGVLRFQRQILAEGRVEEGGAGEE